MKYEPVDKPSRYYMVDENGKEICGARQPFGHDEWVITCSPRISRKAHQVIALSREAAVAHVHMIAELCGEGPDRALALWAEQLRDDNDRLHARITELEAGALVRETALRAAQFDGVDCSGALADIGEGA